MGPIQNSQSIPSNLPQASEQEVVAPASLTEVEEGFWAEQGNVQGLSEEVAKAQFNSFF